MRLCPRRVGIPHIAMMPLRKQEIAPPCLGEALRRGALAIKKFS